MKPISLGQASKFTSPNPVSIVCTQTPSGATNLATVSWWNYLSFNPGMIGFAMAQTSYSGELVRKTGKVILTVPGAALADAAMSCGSVSGRDVDKVKEFGIELTELPDTPIRVPAQSRVAIQCSLKQTVEVGDHFLYICTVEQAYGDPSHEALFAWGGYSKLAPAQTK